MGKFDDKGIFGPNKYKKKESHPSHTGIIDIGYDTLKALNVAMKENGVAKLEVSGWRKTDKPDQISLKVQIPRERDSGPRPSRDREDDRPAERSRGSVRRDDEPRRDDRDRDEPRRSRDRDLDDEIPFDDRRSSRRDSREDDRPRETHSRYDETDYGGDRDL